MEAEAGKLMVEEVWIGAAKVLIQPLYVFDKTWVKETVESSARKMLLG